MLKIVKELGMRHSDSDKKPRSFVEVQCLSCGTFAVMLKQNAMKHNKEKKQYCKECWKTSCHHMTHTRPYRIWRGMKVRVTDKEDKNYGGRGIEMSREWFNSFEAFWSDMSEGYSDDLTIERIDVNKPYTKGNCRWASNMEQQSNKRNNRYVLFQGEQLHLAELVRRSGCSKMKLLMRLNRGMTGDEAVMDALTSPYGKSQNPKNKLRREKRMSTTL